MTSVRSRGANWPGCSGSGTRCPAGAAAPTTPPSPARSAACSPTAGCRSACACPPSASSPRRSAISRTTVTAAYRELRETGHLTSRRGAGQLDHPAQRAPGRQLRAVDARRRPRPDRPGLRRARPRRPSWSPAARAAADDLPRYLGGAGYHPTGLVELREAVAGRLHRRAALPTSPEQILITSGVAARARPGAAAARSRPARRCWSSRRPTPTRWPRSPPAGPGSAPTASTRRPAGTRELLLGALRQTRPAAGLPDPRVPEPDRPPDAGRAARAARRRRPRAPAPTWSSTSPSWTCRWTARRCRRRSPSSTGTRRVLTIGGMSKPYWGGLRIGWVRASAPLVQRLAALRVGVDMAGPVLDQLVAVHLLAAARRDRSPPAGAQLRRAARRAGRRAARAPARVAVHRAGRRGDPLGRAGRPGLQRAGPRRRGRRACGSRPARGSASTARWSASCGCRSRCPADDLVEAVRRIAAARYDLDRGHPVAARQRGRDHRRHRRSGCA